MTLSTNANSHLIFSAFSFKANTASVKTTVTDEETGEERKRMINRMRWKGYGPASVMFSDMKVRLNKNH